MSVNPGTSSPGGFTIVESTFNDPGNGLYTQTPADLLATDTFTAIRADGPFTYTSLSDPNPFSVTDLYTITAQWVHGSRAVQFQSLDQFEQRPGAGFAHHSRLNAYEPGLARQAPPEYL